MGFFSNKISRDELKAGDHIYSWRTAHIYSHHGIYVGNGEVIHFTQGGELETFLDKIIVSSVPKNPGDNLCPKCGDQSKLNGVISSCLTCFLAGGNLYLFQYGVSPGLLMAKPRGGICTTATSDSPEDVISRAKFLLLSTKGFGSYDLLTNNCEDFAIYCKTSLIVLSKLGSSGQASAARNAFSCAVSGLVNSLSVGSTARYLFASTAGLAVTGFTGLAVVGFGYGQYCVGRLNADIGVRKDATKMSVEKLVDVIAVIEGGLDKNKMSVEKLVDVIAVTEGGLDKNKMSVEGLVDVIAIAEDRLDKKQV